MFKLQRVEQEGNMSTSQQHQITNQNFTPYLGPPKKFLKKGEGLKRFAAYRPPLPLSTNKMFQRRQTFVKFKLHSNNKGGDTESDTSSFPYSDILSNESINLSTEIPKMAPPKIMHTPIRPDRKALGALRPSNFNSQYDTATSEELNYPMHEKNIVRKLSSVQPAAMNKMISFNGFRKPHTPGPCITPPSSSPVAQARLIKEAPKLERKSKATLNFPQASEDNVRELKRYNLRGSRKPANDNTQVKNDNTTTQKKEPRKTRRQMKAVVERHISPAPQQPSTNLQEHKINLEKIDSDITESQINGNIEHLMKKIEEKKSSLEGEKLSSEDGEDDEDVVAESCQDNIDKNSAQTSQIQSTSKRLRSNHGYDLSTPSPGSCILALGQQIQHIQNTVNELKKKTMNCKCGAMLDIPQQSSAPRPTRRAATKMKAINKTPASTITTTTLGPSAYVDNPTAETINGLIDDVNELRARFDEMAMRQ